MRQLKSGLIMFGVVACFAVGAGVEHVRQRQVESARKQEALKAPCCPKAGESGAALERRVVDALRRRVSDLEQALCEREARQVPLAWARCGVAAARPGAAAAEAFWGPLPLDRPCGLLLSACEGWAEPVERRLDDALCERRNRFIQMIGERAMSLTNSLAAADVQGLFEGQHELRVRLSAAVARATELRAHLGSLSDAELTKEERRDLRESAAEVGELYRAERRCRFEEVAREAGYEGEQVSRVADYLQLVVDHTKVPQALIRRVAAPKAKADQGGVALP